MSKSANRMKRISVPRRSLIPLIVFLLFPTVPSNEPSAAHGSEHGESGGTHPAPQAHTVEPRHEAPPPTKDSTHGTGDSHHAEVRDGDGKDSSLHADSATDSNKSSHDLEDKTHNPVSVHGSESSKHDAGGHPPNHALKRPKLDSGTLAGRLPVRKFTWNSRQGPLLLASDVVVGPGQTLEIGPGTEIRVAARDPEPAGAGDWIDSQYVSLIVDGGTLRLLGSPARPIRFLPLRKGPAPHWGGIRIIDTRPEQVEIRWTDLPRAHIGVDMERSTGQLRHLVVRDAGIGIRATGGAAPEISHSIVVGSRIAGLHAEKSGPLVRATIFADNKGPGARFEGVGLARLESNAFWNNAGGDILRGPPKTGGWTSDTIVKPDIYGNVRTNPVFRASSLHAKLLDLKRDSLQLAPIWKRRLPENPRGDGPWALSPFSPLLDRGSLSPLCRDKDGSACDIGLWGGKD